MLSYSSLTIFGKSCGPTSVLLSGLVGLLLGLSSVVSGRFLPSTSLPTSGTEINLFCGWFNWCQNRVNHWLVLITFLQHTDPLLPHYRGSAFTFPRGALTTLDRNLLGDCGKLMGWIGAHSTNGISETHVLHHVSSKIPHYNAYVLSINGLDRSWCLYLVGRPVQLWRNSSQVVAFVLRELLVVGPKSSESSRSARYLVSVHLKLY